MRVSRRRAAVRCPTALAFSLVALTGCSGEGDGQAAATAPVASATPSASADETAPTSDGRTYLSVRPAQKKAHTQFEAWVIVPGKGPYTEVRMAEGAKVLLSVPIGDEKHASSYSQAEFVSRLTAQSSSARSLLGYDPCGPPTRPAPACDAPCPGGLSQPPGEDDL
jgi:hypothetical protein